MNTITNEIITKSLLNGTGYVHGKQRVFEFFKKETNLVKRSNMLKKEYGTGGMTGPNEPKLNWDAKGLSIDNTLLTWKEVAKRIGDLIDAGKYYVNEEKEGEKTMTKITNIMLDEAMRKTIDGEIMDYFTGKHKTSDEPKFLVKHLSNYKKNVGDIGIKMIDAGLEFTGFGDKRVLTWRQVANRYKKILEGNQVEKPIKKEEPNPKPHKESEEQDGNHITEELIEEVLKTGKNIDHIMAREYDGEKLPNILKDAYRFGGVYGPGVIYFESEKGLEILYPEYNEGLKLTWKDIVERLKKMYANKNADAKENDEDFQIIKSKHTKTNKDIWLVKILKTLDSDDYIKVNQFMHKFGGYYSKFTHSFIFDHDPEKEIGKKIIIM